MSINILDHFIIKHQQLLEKIYSVSWNIQSGGRQGIKFKQFSYEIKTRGNIITLGPFPVAWSDDITGGYRKKVIDMIWDVGIEMTKFLRNEKNSLPKKEEFKLLKSNIFE